MPIIRFKRDLAAAWAAQNPVLDHGEPGFETDTGRMKIGANSAHWNDLPYVDQNLGGGILVQRLHADYGEIDSGTTVLPVDDTIPENTDGTEFMSLAITPQAAGNLLTVMGEIFLSGSISNLYLTMALFKDGNAVATRSVYHLSGQTPVVVSFHHAASAGATIPITFSVRAGAHQAATCYMNAIAGLRHFGTSPKSHISIWETTS